MEYFIKLNLFSLFWDHVLSLRAVVNTTFSIFNNILSIKRWQSKGSLECFWNCILVDEIQKSGNHRCGWKDRNSRDRQMWVQIRIQLLTTWPWESFLTPSDFGFPICDIRSPQNNGDFLEALKCSPSLRHTLYVCKTHTCTPTLYEVLYGKQETFNSLCSRGAKNVADRIVYLTRNHERDIESNISFFFPRAVSLVW